MSETLEIGLEDDGVATVRLNRPDVHNAFNEELIAALHRAFDELGRDEAVRVVILRGRGANFCAGADLDWMRRAADFGPEENRRDAEKLSEMLHALNSLPKPVVALVQGAAVGGGVGLVACADIVVAVRDARFAFTEVRLGLTPATISPYVIAKIGESAARRYFLTGERFDAVAAHAMGLVHELVGGIEDLDTAAARITEALLAAPPGALAATKALIAAVKGRPIDAALRSETARIIAERRESDEAREGIAAFFARRRPGWAPARKDDAQTRQGEG